MKGNILVRFDPLTNCLEIIDEGEGIDKTTVHKILSGSPVDSSIGTNKEEGTGIGLVTCLKLAELNKGRISFESNSPSGTIAKVRLRMSA